MAVKPLATGRSATSPKGTNTQGCIIDVPNVDAIPIIFIPGIMGSNIRNTAIKKPVWTLGNGVGITKTIVQQWRKMPEQLQIQLDAENTEVDPNGEILAKFSQMNVTEKELRDRGWGTVHWDSYGKILCYLQEALEHAGVDAPQYVSPLGNGLHHLSFITDWKEVLNAQQLKPKFNPQLPFKNIQESEINHLKGFDFPVYALGYNWLQSNEISAQKLAKRLDEIKAELCGRFHKFIIVSHSMGGLVTRRLAQLRQADIAGVVHGVMPSDGAAATYRRLVSGSLEKNVYNPVSHIEAKVMGETTQHMTAVLANSCGGLELLPTADYDNGEPWLILSGKNEKGQNVTVKLPQKDATGKTDPYSQIYKSDKVWWQMVKAEFLNPANIQGITKDTYYKKIEKVESLHKKILKSYHPCTYVYYGSDENNSFGKIQWTLDRPIVGLTPDLLKNAAEMQDTQAIVSTLQNDSNQAIRPTPFGMGQKTSTAKVTADDIKRDGIRYIDYRGKVGAITRISGHDTSGDGTVPVASANTPLNKPGVQQVCAMKGFDHQGSYNNPNVKLFVLYAITRIVKDNNIQPKYT